MGLFLVRTANDVGAVENKKRGFMQRLITTGIQQARSAEHTDP